MAPSVEALLFALWIPLSLLACLGLMTLAQLTVDRRHRSSGWVRSIASSTLRGGVARSVIVLAVAPGLALTLLLASKRLADKEAYESGLLIEAAHGAARQVDVFLARHTAGVRSAAEAIELDNRPSVDRTGQWLLRYHPIYPDFLTMLVSDTTGTVVTASRREGESFVIADVGKRDVSDRHYFLHPRSDGRDYVSPAFRGRGLGTDPLVAISSRINIAGRPYGIVEGSLNLSAFQRLDTSYRQLLNAHMVIADASGVVIYADPDTGYSVLESLASQPVAKARHTTEIMNVADRNDGSALLVAHAATERGWSIFILRAKPTLAQTLESVWWVALGWLGACALAAIALAWSLVRRVGVPLQRLTVALNRYQSDQRSPFRSLAGLPAEYITIFRHLHSFIVRLASRHRQLVRALAHAEALQDKLRGVIGAREQEIAQRTRELAVANQELQLLSQTDPLTRLFNRRWLEREYERMWRVAAREREHLSVVLIDVDFFKRYNDSYGHPAGDEVLKRVASALQTSLHRPEDFAARYGGEEFMIVLGNTSIDGACEVAERIRDAVIALNVAHRDSPHRVVTVSVGVCDALPGPGVDPDAALRLADDMLYEAKALGRNRIAAAQLPAGDSSASDCAA